VVQLSVRGDEGKHGGHIRLYHPRALGNPCQGYLPSIQDDLLGDGLGDSIGGHNGAAAIPPVVLIEPSKHCVDTLAKPIHRQVLTDNSSGKRENLLRPAPALFGKILTCAPGIEQTAFAGAGIGVSCID